MTIAPDPVEGWVGLGTTGRVTVEAVELVEVGLAFRHPVRTARGEHRHRPTVLVRLLCSGPDGAVDGWGECAALADTTYDPEDAGSAWSVLADGLSPALFERCADGLLPPPAALGDLRRVVAPDSPLAFAALEMAVADAHLRATGMSLAALLGVHDRPVAVGAVVGQFQSTDELVSRVEALVAGGTTRVKVKIGPGADVGPLAALRERFPGLALQVDANESYAESDLSHLVRLDRFGLLCVEQPFSRDDLPAHVRLATLIDTPVCLDESLTSPGAVMAALDAGACSVVCVKPARLGGIGAALETVAACRSAGVPVWMGGMFESGYARQVNAALAALPGFAWPGDLGAPEGYLVEDLVSDGPWSGGSVLIPRVPGCGPSPDPEAVDRLAVRRTRIGPFGPV
jgi:O-succinylbenzoate synthase